MIHIGVRVSPDWTDEEDFRRHLEPSMAPKVATWDATFRTSWRMFRAALTKIARDSLAQVEGGVVTRWDDVPEGDLVLPVDDDDWFAPDILRWLTPMDDGHVTGVLWRQAVLQAPINFGHRIFLLRQRLQPSLPPRWVCATNNYAIRKGPLDWQAFRSHVHADVHFRGNSAIPVVPRHLSLQNRTLASMTSMGWQTANISRRMLLAKRREYLSLYARWTPPSEELGWCLPYVEQVRALTEGLEPR